MTGNILLNSHAIGILSDNVTFVDDSSTAPGHHAFLGPGLSAFTGLDINLASIGQLNTRSIGVQRVGLSIATSCRYPNFLTLDDVITLGGNRYKTGRTFTLNIVVPALRQVLN